MSLSRSCWIATAPAGVRWWREPSVCARNTTPSSWTVRSPASDITWKPPESVRMGPGQFMNLCRPPKRAMRSAPGRIIRW